MDGNDTYIAQSSAALASAFLVTSQPSSSPIGSRGIEHTPMMTMIANIAPSLLGRTVDQLAEQVKGYRKQMELTGPDER